MMKVYEMKKLNYKRLSLTFLITFLTSVVPACFQITPSLDTENAKLVLGFPFDFYMIKYASEKFWFHFNIAGFLANVVVTYLILTFFVLTWRKVKGEQK